MIRPSFCLASKKVAVCPPLKRNSPSRARDIIGHYKAIRIKHQQNNLENRPVPERDSERGMKAQGDFMFEENRVWYQGTGNSLVGMSAFFTPRPPDLPNSPRGRSSPPSGRNSALRTRILNANRGESLTRAKPRAELRLDSTHSCWLNFSGVPNTGTLQSGGNASMKNSASRNKPVQLESSSTPPLNLIP